MSNSTYVLLTPPRVAFPCIGQFAGNGYVAIARVHDEASGQIIVDLLNALKGQVDTASASLRERVLHAVSDAIEDAFDG